MKPVWDIACVADLCVDLVVTGNVTPRFHQIEQLVDGYSIEPGGSATIFAAQFAKLGGDIGLLGAVGADTFGNFLVREMQSTGVDLSGVRRLPDCATALGLHLVQSGGDRAMLTALGSISRVDTTDLTEDLLKSVRHWHVASPFLLNTLKDAWPDWLRRCRNAGLSISMDTNWDPDENWNLARELLPFTDVFLPNEQEARAIADCPTVELAGVKLSKSCGLVIVKRGVEGAEAYRNGTLVHSFKRPTYAPPICVVDTVGAGDSFDAGFVCGWLHGVELEECLRMACACGEATLSQPGGLRGQLTSENMAAYLRHAYTHS